jgi:hypothetical protein
VRTSDAITDRASITEITSSETGVGIFTSAARGAPDELRAQEGETDGAGNSPEKLGQRRRLNPDIDVGGWSPKTCDLAAILGLIAWHAPCSRGRP